MKLHWVANSDEWNNRKSILTDTLNQQIDLDLTFETVITTGVREPQRTQTLLGSEFLMSKRCSQSAMVLKIFPSQLCQLIHEQSFKALKSRIRTCINLVIVNFFIQF